ncbi:MAG: PAS-domain containing protein, partial [Holosporales bacterium]|nr:PAS-domain containing protein [Holosporales bacterium]
MKYVNDLLINSSAMLPIAYASWIFQGDEVFVSERLKIIINASSNFIEPGTFVKIIRKTFGSFLDTAVKKISSHDAVRNEYSSTSKVGNTCFVLKLVFDQGKQIYVFTVTEVLHENKKKEGKDSAKFEEVLDVLPAYIWKKNKYSQITYCNKTYADALEVTKEYVVANNIKLVTFGDNTVADQNWYITAKSRKSIRHVVIGGSRRFLSITETPFAGTGDSIGVAIDITDMEELQREYSNYKRQTEETFDNISVPVAIFDANTVLIFANSAIIKLFSIEGLDLFNSCKFSDVMDHLINNESIITTSDILRYKSEITRLFQTITDPYHATVNFRNGKTMNVTISPNRGGGLIFMFEDLSSEIALRREIKSISAVQAEILEHLSEGVLIFGGDNRIKILNSVISEIWSYPEQTTTFFEMHVKKFFELRSDFFVSTAEFELFISKLVDMSTKRIIFSGKIILSSGKTISYFCTPLPEGLNLVKFSDITEIVSLQGMLQEKNSIISQVDKLKTTLISNISSELQSPLKTICGFTEILCNQYFGKLNEKQF